MDKGPKEDMLQSSTRDPIFFAADDHLLTEMSWNFVNLTHLDHSSFNSEPKTNPSRARRDREIGHLFCTDLIFPQSLFRALLRSSSSSPSLKALVSCHDEVDFWDCCHGCSPFCAVRFQSW